MKLNRDDIAGLIPHAGRMVLLDGVVEWDDAHIVCMTTAHQDRANPLYVSGHLSSVCGIEFAAQAMAVHGALLGKASRGLQSQSQPKPRAGFLASVRSVDLHVDRLDAVLGVMTVEATREAGDGNHVLYRFELRSGRTPVVSGRAAVVLEMAADGDEGATSDAVAG